MATFNSPSDSSFKPKDMKLIGYDTVITGTKSVLSVGSIPQTFKSLLIKSKFRVDALNQGAVQVLNQFNNDSDSTKYVGRRSALGPTYGADTPDRNFGFAAGPTAPAGSFTTSTATIIGYSSSSDRKSYHILLDYLPDPVNITVRSWVFSYQYTDTTPITSITVSPQLGDFVVGSSLAVYGLK